MGVIKDYVNQGFSVGDITVSTFDETGARIRIKDFYDLDLVERQRIVNLAGKVDVELINTENKITVETDGKLAEYYKSSEVDSKFYNKTETDSKFYNKTEIESAYVKKTQLATPESPGVISINEMKKQIRMSEILGVLGLNYGGYFGISLKNIEANKVYFYEDAAAGRLTPYVALSTKSGTFLTPDTDNFKNLTIRDNLFYKKLDIVLPGNEYIRLANAYIHGNMLFIDGFIMNSEALNSLPADSTIAVLNLMIPALTNYGIYDATMAGSNLSVYSDFRIKKYLNTSVVSGQPFLIAAGLTKGTIS